MFKLPGVKSGSDLESLFLTVGFIVVQWGTCEQWLDMMVSLMYHKYPGARPKKLPFMLEPKLNFLRERASCDLTLSALKADMLALADEFTALSKIRHDLIHGAIANIDLEDGAFRFIKFDVDNNMNDVRTVLLRAKDFPSLTKRLLVLGNKANHLAQKISAKMPNAS